MRKVGVCICCSAGISERDCIERREASKLKTGVCETCLVTFNLKFNKTGKKQIHRARLHEVFKNDYILKNEVKNFVQDQRSNEEAENVAVLNDYRRKSANNEKTNRNTSGVAKEGAVLKKKATKPMSPASIRAILDKGLVGNEDLKRDISVMISKNTSKKFKTNNNAIIMGESGSGKTELCKVLANGLSVPMLSFSIKDVSPVGYVGKNITDVYTELYHKASKNKTLAENAIIHIDEIDKLYTEFDDGISRLLEDTILAHIEGTEIAINQPKGSTEKPVTINTSDITFILTGAFCGIEKHVSGERGRVGLTNSMSLKKESFDYSKVKRSHLSKFGVKKELLGRCPVISHTKKVSKEAMVEFMDMPGGIIEQYEDYFEEYDVEINFEPEALGYIAELALEEGTGMRGVHSQLSEVTSGFIDIIDEYKGKSITICEELFEEPEDIDEDDFTQAAA